jgi:hypothetical protein
MCARSVCKWKNLETTLLLTNAEHRANRIRIGIGAHVDINPDIEEVKQLREEAHWVAKREHVNPPYPYDSEYNHIQRNY